MTTGHQPQSDSLIAEMEKARNGKNPLPAENLEFIQRFTDAIGIKEYLAKPVKEPYVRAERRDSGPHLEIYYGYTTGFVFEEEIIEAIGPECKREVSSSRELTWAVWHPKNRGRPSGTRSAEKATAISVDEVPVEVIETERAQVEWSAKTTITQKEAQLTRRFQTYLEMHHREVKRYRIIPAGSATLYSDLADVTNKILYEAKGSTDRMSVRLALGQVLDYGRFVDGSRPAVLLPKKPPADLVELLEKHDVGCVVETKPDEFRDLTKHNRCPITK